MVLPHWDTDIMRTAFRRGARGMPRANHRQRRKAQRAFERGEYATPREALLAVLARRAETLGDIFYAAIAPKTANTEEIDTAMGAECCGERTFVDLWCLRHKRECRDIPPASETAPTQESKSMFIVVRRDRHGALWPSPRPCKHTARIDAVREAERLAMMPNEPGDSFVVFGALLVTSFVPPTTARAETVSF